MHHNLSLTRMFVVFTLSTVVTYMIIKTVDCSSYELLQHVIK